MFPCSHWTFFLKKKHFDINLLDSNKLLKIQILQQKDKQRKREKSDYG